VLDGVYSVGMIGSQELKPTKKDEERVVIKKYIKKINSMKTGFFVRYINSEFV